MNFIDRAIANRHTMSADDFLQAMADIYKEPQVWNVLDRYPQYIQDVILIIDYDTFLQMEGPYDFLTGQARRQEETAAALERAGLNQEAALIRRANGLYLEEDCEETYEEELDAIADSLALYNKNSGTYEEFWAQVISYIEQNKD